MDEIKKLKEEFASTDRQDLIRGFQEAVSLAESLEKNFGKLIEEKTIASKPLVESKQEVESQIPDALFDLDPMALLPKDDLPSTYAFSSIHDQTQLDEAFDSLLKEKVFTAAPKKLTESQKKLSEAVTTVKSDLTKLAEDAKRMLSYVEAGMINEDEANIILGHMVEYLEKTYEKVELTEAVSDYKKKIEASDVEPFLEQYPECKEDLDVKLVDGEKVYQMKSKAAKDLNDTHKLFTSGKPFQEYMDEAEGKVKEEILKAAKKKKLKGFKVEIDSKIMDSYVGDDAGAIYATLKMGDNEVEFEPESMYYKGANENGDAMRSYTWAAWLMADDSPFQDDNFTTAYAECQIGQAMEQFSHTLNEGSFHQELDKALDELAQGDFEESEEQEESRVGPIEAKEAVEARNNILKESSGSGWGSYTQGKEITSIHDLKVGGVYLDHSLQFDAKNIVKITKIKLAVPDPSADDYLAYMHFVDPNDFKKARQGGDKEFAVWDHDLGQGVKLYELGNGSDKAKPETEAYPDSAAFSDLQTNNLSDATVENIQESVDLSWEKLSNGDLEVSLKNPEDKEHVGKDFHDAFEHMLANGMDNVSPEEIGALTDAPIFGEVSRDDQGKITHIDSLYWFPDYAVKNPAEELKEKGKVVFKNAKDEVEDVSSESVTEDEDEYKKLDKLQQELQTLYKSNDPKDAEKAKALQPQVDALFKKLYDVRRMKSESKKKVTEALEGRVIEKGDHYFVKAGSKECKLRHQHEGPQLVGKHVSYELDTHGEAVVKKTLHELGEGNIDSPIGVSGVEGFRVAKLGMAEGERLSDSDLQDMSGPALLQLIRDKKVTYPDVDKALEKQKRFQTLDWIGDQLAKDELKGASYSNKPSESTETKATLAEADPSLQPPKRWFNKMAKRIKKTNPDYDKDQVKNTIGDIWYHKLSQAKKSEIRGREGKTLGPAESVKVKVKKVMKEDSDTPPRIYVGTYGKYSSGSIDGAWLNLDDYKDKDEFYEAARELHKDESDPELMFQDYEGFPEQYYNESSTPDELWAWLALSPDQREILEMYIEATGNSDATIEKAEEAFQGKYDSEEDWAQQFLDDTGGMSEENAAYYLTVTDTDARLIGVDEADSFVADADDDDILEKADMKDEYDDEEDETKKEAILQKAKDECYSIVSDEVEAAIKNDAIGYFVESGMYSMEDFMKASFVSIDYKAYARDAEINGDIDFIRKDGETWAFWGNI